MNRTVLLAAVIGALVVAVLVGGFIALDKTTLHWYESAKAAPTATPVAAIPAGFTKADAITLTENAIGTRLYVFPENTHWERCVDAQYRSGSRKWIVTCNFLANRDDRTPITSRSFVFDDQTGNVDLATGR